MTTAIDQRAEVCTRDDRYDEVWDGELVMAPMPNTEHQRIVGELYGVTREVIGRPGLRTVYPG